MRNFWENELTSRKGNNTQINSKKRGGHRGEWGANLPGRDSGWWDHSKPRGAERQELSRLAAAWARPRPRGWNGRTGGRGDGRGGGSGGGRGVGEVWRVEVGVLGSVMVKTICQLNVNEWRSRNNSKIKDDADDRGAKTWDMSAKNGASCSRKSKCLGGSEVPAFIQTSNILMISSGVSLKQMIFSLFNQYFISLAFFWDFAKQLWKEFAVLQKFATRTAPYTFLFHIYASLFHCNRVILFYAKDLLYLSQQHLSKYNERSLLCFLFW